MVFMYLFSIGTTLSTKNWCSTSPAEEKTKNYLTFYTHTPGGKRSFGLKSLQIYLICFCFSTKEVVVLHLIVMWRKEQLQNSD